MSTERTPKSLGFTLKVSSSNGVTEIQTGSGREIVKWTGFDGSDFGDEENRKHAAYMVRASNAYLPMIEALECCRKVLLTKASIRSKPAGTSEGTALRALEAALKAAKGEA